MKKVQYAIGALGLAPVMALPLTHPAATPHASTATGKRVNLTADMQAARPAVTCHHSADHSARTTGPVSGISLFADWDGKDCVFGVRGAVNFIDHNLDLRVRLRSNGNLVSTRFFTSASFGDDSTFWNGVINRDIPQICVATVLSFDHSSIQSGPICVNT